MAARASRLRRPPAAPRDLEAQWLQQHAHDLHMLGVIVDQQHAARLAGVAADAAEAARRRSDRAGPRTAAAAR